MPLPTLWTEASLIAAMEAEVEGVLDDLGLGDTDLLVTAVGTDTPAVLGVLSVTDVTYGGVADVVKVLVIARWCAWQRAYDKAITTTDLKAGTVDLKGSQTFEHLTARLAEARAAAMRYSEVVAAQAGGSVASLSSMSTAGSPYGYSPCTGW